VDDGIPHRAAASLQPPLAAPGLGRHLESFVLEPLGRIAGDRPETPEQFSGVDVVSGDISPYSELDPCIADHDFAVEYTRSAGDGVRPLLVIHRQGRPEGRASPRIERYQSSIERADDDLAFVNGQSAAYDVTADEPAPLRRNFRIVAPQLFAGLRIQRDGDVP